MRFLDLLRAREAPPLFLTASEPALHGLLTKAGFRIPNPQPLFLEGEVSADRHVYLVLESPALTELEGALDRATEALAATDASLVGEEADAAREYEAALYEILSRVTAADYGRHFPSIFWLDHGGAIARSLARPAFRASRYRTLDGLRPMLDRVVARVRSELAPTLRSTGPGLYGWMAEAEIPLAEENVGSDLEGLDELLEGRYGVDPERFRGRWRALRAWHDETGRETGALAAVDEFASHLLDWPGRDCLLTTTGYVSCLARAHPDWEARGLWDAREIAAWEDLLPRLQAWELARALREITLRVRREGSELLLPARQAERLHLSTSDVPLSPTLRPLDFASPWVVDPGVSRSGLVYDIIHFTTLVTGVGGTGDPASEAAFRAFFHLQRRLDAVAEEHRLYREKYLGDGVFYTGRDSRRLLVAAVRMQRIYRRALAEGFPFDRGMRIALNHGDYRLLPFGGPRDQGGERYEIFGESVVELFRLTSGKSGQDLEELRALLLSRGYSAETVDRFFAPLAPRQGNAGTQRTPPFAVTITPAGQLVNNGIVATHRVLTDLVSLHEIEHFVELEAEDRHFVGVRLTDADRTVEIGIRPLGRADLKGLESPALYEIVDREILAGATHLPLAADDLFDALDRLPVHQLV